MAKILLVIGITLIGISAIGQNQGTNPTTTVGISKYQQIKSLEDLVHRLGEHHEESIKAKKMLQALKKELADVEQKQMSETLSPIEYDRWKAKQTQTKNATAIKTEEKN